MDLVWVLSNNIWDRVNRPSSSFYRHKLPKLCWSNNRASWSSKRWIQIILGYHKMELDLQWSPMEIQISNSPNLSVQLQNKEVRWIKGWWTSKSSFQGRAVVPNSNTSKTSLSQTIHTKMCSPNSKSLQVRWIKMDLVDKLYRAKDTVGEHQDVRMNLVLWDLLSIYQIRSKGCQVSRTQALLIDLISVVDLRCKQVASMLVSYHSPRLVVS